MTFRIQLSSSIPLNKLRKELDGRVNEATKSVARKLIRETAEEVARRIPPGAGWLNIYKRAITYRENPTGTEWAVAGLAEIDLRDPPANTSLAAFQGNDEFSALLTPYNPWPIDMIPPIGGGYKGNVVIRNVSEASVNEARDRIRPLLGTIEGALTDAGATVLPPEHLVEVGGKVYADIAYMAERLELGYDGYPRIPHWGPAASKLESMAERWAQQSDSTEEVYSALRGKVLSPGETMSTADAAKLRQIRDASWP